jgi:hypothetical protein
MGDVFSWSMVTALGAFHGINPGMGWLFAVALGLQERRRSAVIAALVPLGLGHALAVAAAVAVAVFAGAILPAGMLRWIVGAGLLLFGGLRLISHRHPRWASMRVGFRRLTLWSFLMATAHGAGLMVVPVFLGMVEAASPIASGHSCHVPASASGTVWASVVATGLHAAGYLAVTGVVSIVVFEKFGVGLLRKAWLNLDVLWAAALLVTGAVTFLL